MNKNMIYMCIYIYVYIHTYTHNTKNEIASFSQKWIKLEVIMLSKISLTQKGQILDVFSHMWNLDH
jgi:hypothetical protein